MMSRCKCDVYVSWTMYTKSKPAALRTSTPPPPPELPRPPAPSTKPAVNATQISLLEREISDLRADRVLMTTDAIDDRLARIHARVKDVLR